MKPELTALLTFLFQATSALTVPGADHQAHCTEHPIFTLHNITYSDDTIYSTPARLAVAGASIQFNLTNTAVNYITECGAYIGDWAWPTFFWGNVVYDCKVPVGEDPGQVRTNFTYSSSGNIQLNSTWSCGEWSQKESFMGMASGVLKLDCNTTSWQNTNWTLGELWSTRDTTCKPYTLNVTPAVSHAGGNSRNSI